MSKRPQLLSMERVLTKFPIEVDDLKEAHYSEEVREVVDLVFGEVSR